MNTGNYLLTVIKKLTVVLIANITAYQNDSPPHTYLIITNITFLCRKTYKNYGFIARMINLFVLLHYRNRCYGNEYYDKLMDMFLNGIPIFCQKVRICLSMSLEKITVSIS